MQDTEIIQFQRLTFLLHAQCNAQLRLNTFNILSKRQLVLSVGDQGIDLATPELQGVICGALSQVLVYKQILLL